MHPVQRSPSGLLVPALLILFGAACDGGVQVRGLVRDARHQPIAGATIRLDLQTKSHRYQRTGQTRANGCFFYGMVLPPSRFDVRLRALALAL